MPDLSILFIMDPLEGVIVDHDTTFAFMLEAQSRGHRVFHCEMKNLVARGSEVWAGP